ncbi:MAG: restriction endonuclease [Candidatus Woesearchaeota archaeon]
MTTINKNNGTGLENFVFELYKDLGYSNVIKDYRIKKSNGEESAHGQIDLTYSYLMIKRYVECKQRTNSKVNFDDYSKFETTLKTFNIPLYLGEIVTNSYFDNKVKLRAKETKIKLIDRDELIRLNNLRNSGWRISVLMYRFMDILGNKGVSSATNYLLSRNMSIDKQIESYSK